MSMTSTQRDHVVANLGIAPQVIRYMSMHSKMPGNYPLTYAAMLQEFGWDANDPTNTTSIATMCASIKAGVDTLQSA